MRVFQAFVIKTSAHAVGQECDGQADDEKISCRSCQTSWLDSLEYMARFFCSAPTRASFIFDQAPMAAEVTAHGFRQVLIIPWADNLANALR